MEPSPGYFAADTPEKMRWFSFQIGETNKGAGQYAKKIIQLIVEEMVSVLT